jgi:ABC-type Na+ efflux pump permease subunit
MKKRYMIILVVAILVVIAAIPVVFFMFTVTASEPQAAMVTVANEPARNDTSVRTKISLILYGENGVYRYEGIDINSGKVCSGEGELRAYLAEALRRNGGDGVEIEIRRTKSASYKNVVNTLDEMVINVVKRYSLTGASEQDERFVNSLQQGAQRSG